MTPMYIDSHAHLFYEDFRQDLPDVMRRARDAGVEVIVVPGTTLETSKEAVELAQQYPFVFACVGYHPHEAQHATDALLKEIEDLSAAEKVVAIGEVGLDFHYDFSPRERQIEVFRKQLSIAVRKNLPVVVHTRESMKEAIDAVAYVVAENACWRRTEHERIKGMSALRGVFHCFTGTVEEANRLFELGFLVSYPGIVTFMNSPVIDALKSIGLDRILIETDSPYLSPVPLRGKRNEPANVVLVANKVAEVFGMAPHEVGRITSANSRALFGLNGS